jgi:ceramide glucosyltransferase
VGVGILGDRQVLRDLWLLIPRDIIALGVWAWSYASDTVRWREEKFKLEKGRLIRLEQGDVSTRPAPAAPKPQQP